MPKSLNFTECANRYINSPSLISLYNYSGPVRLIPSNPDTQITYRGCVALCGTGNDWYDWSVSSSFITTWVLPIVGTLLQAPFESNAFWQTIKATCRWVGSPISSLSWILWNIQVSGKCALFGERALSLTLADGITTKSRLIDQTVDMATPYESLPDEDSDFAVMRDSFYILMNINQYKMKWPICMTKEAEGLLRILLFGRDLHLPGSRKSLHEKRRKLARSLRSNRRRGVVPVFISTLWFLFSLAISIESAFGNVGDNTEAHDLAVGLFLAWFPTLILCSIVDRNPVASDDIRKSLNKLIDLVCTALQDEANREIFIQSFGDLPDSQLLADWVQKISEKAQFIKNDFFTDFAGQARTRFHYGAAHAILIDIEKSYIADHGRNWLANERQARAALVLGQVDKGLVWFDGRQFWQFFAAVACVAGTGAGGFILSYFTPTVGLSCRSGGYLIFNVVAIALLVSELAVWSWTSPIRKGRIHKLVRRHTGVWENHVGLEEQRQEQILKKRSWARKFLDKIENAIVRTSCSVLSVFRPGPRGAHLHKYEAAIRSHFQALRSLTARQWIERYYFQPLEAMNTIFLVYLVISQTTGAFVNCACKSSFWSRGGGYIDFTRWSHANSKEVGKYWIAGTVLSCVIMGLGMIYVVTEWCLQAHLSTENYANAMRGLRNVRRLRRFTLWLWLPAKVLVLGINYLASALKLRSTNKSRTLLWSKDCGQRSNRKGGKADVQQMPRLQEVRRPPNAIAIDMAGEIRWNDRVDA